MVSIGSKGVKGAGGSYLLGGGSVEGLRDGVY